MHFTISSNLTKEREIEIDRMNKQIIKLIIQFFMLICCFLHDDRTQNKNIFFKSFIIYIQSTYSILSTLVHSTFFIQHSPLVKKLTLSSVECTIINQNQFLYSKLHFICELISRQIIYSK
jgi:hypothetical protein